MSPAVYSPWSDTLSHPSRTLISMNSEQAFEEFIDNERLFVLKCHQGEQVFGEGDAVSVAFELEYETFFPKLRLVPEPPRRLPSRRVQHRRLIVGLAVLALFVLLALPIRAIGGSPATGSTAAPASTPTAGQ